MAILLSSNIDHFNLLPLFLNIIKGMDTMISITMKRTSLAIAMALACPNVSAADLGVAQGFSAFVFGDFTSDSGVAESAIFAKNDVELEGYSIRYRTDVDAEELSLIAGGEIDYESGRVYSGSILSGKEASIDDDVALGLDPNATISENTALPFNIEEAEKELKELSSQLQELTVNGTVDKLWGGLYLTGDGESEIQVFNIDGKEMAKAHTFSVNNIPNDSTIIFNISGVQGKSKKALNNKSFASLESHRTKTIFNFYESEKLDITGTRVQGVVLAPYANISAYSGDFTMPVIAKSWEGSMHLGYDEFDGDLPDNKLIINPQLKCMWSGSENMPEYDQVMAAPIVVQLNDDNKDGVINEKDTPDIVFPTFKGIRVESQGILRAIDGRNCEEIWQASESGPWVDPLFTPAAADIDGDGVVEIVTGSGGGGSNNKLTAFDNHGNVQWQTLTWDARGFPAIADLDRDGTPEIIYQSYVLSNEGEVLFRTMFENREAVVFEQYNDGVNVVLGQGYIYNQDGSRVSLEVTGSKQSIGNFNQDSLPEIVTVQGQDLYLLNNEGEKIWGPVTIPGQGWGTTTIAQLNPSDLPEIIVASSSNLTTFDASGKMLWTKATNDLGSKSTGATTFDFNSDGQEEILYADEDTFYILEGTTGQTLWSQDNPSGTAYEYPVVADTDNDGSADIIVVSNKYSEGASEKVTGVKIFEGKGWPEARTIWNQYSFHQTNIMDNGTVPVNEKQSWLEGNSYRSATIKR